MSRLELAAERLKSALASLEDAVATPAPSSDDGRLQAQLANLEAERERLLTRIAALEEELAAMSGVTEEVEERLDGTIDEIRAVLAR